MKLLRVGPKGRETPAMLDVDGTVRSLSGIIDDISPETVTLESIERLRDVDVVSLPKLSTEARVGSCIASVPNYWCIGLNYRRHAEEAGAKPPPEPIIFNKSTGALSGPNDAVIRPRGSEKLDYEVELAIVIGREARYVATSDALSFVAGYCVVNDISERTHQLERAGQWVKGKSAPTFAPTGPWLVTADEVADPQALRCWLKVNDAVRQDSSTEDMIFGVAEIISYMSQYVCLLPGDIITTGTPEGVGMGMRPEVWLQPGDKIELGVSGLGVQKHCVVENFSQG